MTISKKTIFNIIKNLLFLFIGIILFIWVYKGYDINELIDELKNFNIWYIALSIFFSILSNISRAMRWNLLLDPIGCKVNTFNAFLSIQVMYLANLAVPRAGEIVRCSVLTKYEDVPFTKLVGTVIIERIADTIALLIFALIAIATQISTIKKFFISNPESLEKIRGIFTINNFLYLLGIMIIGIFILIIFRKNFKNTNIYKSIVKILNNLLEGIKTIVKIKKPLLFILHTLFIYLMWLLMLYVFFIGFAPTKDLGIFSAITVFVMSGLAMIAPVQAGIGAYHFMVSSTLLIYGVALKQGLDFAFIIHTSINLYLAIFGLLSIIVLYFFNKKLNNNS